MEIVGGIQGKRAYYALCKWSPGIILRPAIHPDGVDLPENIHEGIMLDPSAPVIPSECWTAMIRLFIYCIERDPRSDKNSTVDANNEVCVVFAAHTESNHVIVAAMPQVVGPARVIMDRTRGACNLITGEYYPSWPPPSYFEIGDCHSHNRMGAFFSGTDDRDDKGLPGVHLVCGSFKHDKGWTYKIATSVVVDQHRYEKVIRQNEDGSLVVQEMISDDICNIAWCEEIKLHDDVMQHVHVDYPKDWKKETVAIVPAQHQYTGWGGNGTSYVDGYNAFCERRAKEMGKTVAEYQDYINNLRKENQEEQYARYRKEADDVFALAHEERGNQDDRDEPHALGHKFGPSVEDIYDMLGLRKSAAATDMPGQLTMFDEIVDNQEPTRALPWWAMWLKQEIDNLYDVIDNVRDICPTENSMRKVIAEALNRTGLFKGKVKPLHWKKGEPK